MVSDDDHAETHTYAVTGGQHADKFVIDSSTGHLSFATDYDVNPQGYPSFVSLNVTVTDKGGLSAISVLEITVQDVNRKPYFYNLPKTLTIPETVTPGSVLYTVSGHDDDIGDVLSYFVNCEPADGFSTLEYNSTSMFM